MFNKRLRELRKNKNLTQKDIGEILSVQVNTYAQYEHGTRRPDYDTIKKLCDFFRVTSDYLLYGTDIGQNSIYSNVRFVPVHSRISFADNNLALADKDIVDNIVISWNDSAEYFGMIMQDDSMSNRNIEPGDYLLIKKQSDIENGAIGLATDETGECFVRIIKKAGNSILLLPANEKFDVIKKTESQLVIIGKVMKQVRLFF